MTKNKKTLRHRPDGLIKIEFPHPNSTIVLRTPAGATRRALAWALGVNRPVASGYSGVCASCWALSFDGGQTWHVFAVPSRDGNRTAWDAGIMAIKGVAECLPTGFQVQIFSTDKQLCASFRAGFINSDGREAAGKLLWRPLLALVQSKHLQVDCDYAPDDEVSKQVKLHGGTLAKAKLDSLGPEKAMRAAIPPRRRNRVKFGSVVSGYVDKPKPISRKKQTGSSET